MPDLYFISNTGHFPKNNASAGLAKADSIKGSYVSSVDVTSGKIKMEFQGPKANTQIHSGALVLSPVTFSGSITWTCSTPRGRPRWTS